MLVTIFIKMCGKNLEFTSVECPSMHCALATVVSHASLVSKHRNTKIEQQQKQQQLSLGDSLLKADSAQERLNLQLRMVYRGVEFGECQLTRT